MDGTRTLINRIAYAIVTVGGASAILMLMLLAGAPAQPQPRIQELATSPDWLFIEFTNGAQWYLQAKHVSAIHALPEKQAETLEYKLKIYCGSATITVPYGVEELERLVLENKANFLLQRLEKMDEEPNE